MNTEIGEIVKDVGAIDWNTLWSGTIGALIAGLVAAGVALYVVNRSTRNASLDVMKMMHENDRLARQSRTDAEAALQRQLGEQRDEARKARELAAIADMMAAINELHEAYEHPLDDIPSVRTKIYAAAYRWMLDGDNFDRSNLILPSVSQLVRLAYYASAPGPDVDVEKRVANLTDATSEFLTMWGSYPSLDAEGIRDHWDWLSRKTWHASPDVSETEEPPNNA